MMNIGQLPPFLIWPYALFHILTRRSVFFMLEILMSEQQKYYKFYDWVKQGLEIAAEKTLDAYENLLEGDCYGVIVILSNTIVLFFGAIFLVMLKMYILFRHLNYMAFVIFFYWGKLLFGQKETNMRGQHQELSRQD